MIILYYYLQLLIFLSIVCNLNAYYEEEWNAAAEFLKEGYDLSAKPCDDFLKYSCGGWIKSETKSAAGTYNFGSTEKKFSRKVQESIFSVDLDNKTTPSYKKSVRAMYDMCLNTSEAQMKNAIRDTFTGLVTVLGIPPILSQDKVSKKKLLNTNIWNFLGRIHQAIPTSVIFFRVKVQKVKTDCHGQQAVLVFVPQTELQPYVTSADIMTDLRGLAKIINVPFDEKEAKREAANIVKFQKAHNDYVNETDHYFSHFSQKEHEAGREISFRTISVKELVAFNPNISWSKYFQGLFTNEQYSSFNRSEISVNIMDGHFLSEFDKLLKQFDIETVFNYMFWRSMKDLFLSLNVIAESTESSPENCFLIVTSLFKTATARIYFDHFDIDPFELRDDLDILASTVFSAFKYLVASSDWMVTAERVAIMNKINQITFYSGIPNWIHNDTEIELRTVPLDSHASFVENLIMMTKMNLFRELDYVIGLRDPNLEQEPFLEVNAFYMSMAIQFKLGLLVPPFYDSKYPLALKYGGVGALIAHELIHGFGIDVIKKIAPHTKPWLKNSTINAYKKKIDCINRQYSSFCVKKQQMNCVNGRTTIEENVSDIDGMKIGFAAYKFARETSGVTDPPIPGLSALSNDQLFFLMLGRIRCSTDVELESSLLENYLDESHFPEVARMVIPFRNFPPFATVFKCGVGSAYSQLESCSMWGNYDATN